VKIHPLVESLFLEWRVRVHNGTPDPKDAGHVSILKEICLRRGIDSKIVDNVLLALDEDHIVKNKKTGNIYTVKNVNKDKHTVIKKNASKDDIEKIKKAKEKDDKPDDAGDSDNKTQSQKGTVVSGIEMPDLDLVMPGEKIGTVLAQNKEIVYPLIEKTANKVEELLKDGKKEEARILAQTLVDKYELTKPIYLQPGKANKAKLYVGSKYRYATGTKNEGSVGQKNIVDVFEKAGVKVPPKPGGISRTAVAPNEVHTKRKVGTVKTNMKDGKIVSKEVTIGERKFTIKADPNDPLAQKKLETLPDGEVEFCDINSAHTDEGRTECIVNASNNMIDMFDKIESQLTDEFNIEIASNVKSGLKKLQRLEEEKNNAATTGARQKLQEEFDQVCLDIMAATKINNPNGVNEFVNMTAYMAETFEAMSLLNKGIETYIPSSGNFKTSDVLSVMGGDQIKSTVTSVDGRHADDGVLYIKGTSVKFAGGGASQMPNKNENSSYKDNDVEIIVNGEKRKGTLNVLKGLTDYYDRLFPDSDEAQKPISDDELKQMYDDNLNTLYEYYPQFRDSDVLEEVMGKAKNAAKNQLKRLNQEKMKSSEGLENAQKRMEFYHFNQWVATMVYNHPERGMKTQSYSNSDYVTYKRDKKTYVKRVHSNGTDSVVWHGWDPDQGYMVNNKGKITPSNVYSSRMKHNNPAEYWIKKAQK